MSDKFSIKLLFGLHENLPLWRPLEREQHPFQVAPDGAKRTRNA
jgi:hypothetical protein